MSRSQYTAPDFKGNVVAGVGTPGAGTDAANKAYVDGHTHPSTSEYRYVYDSSAVMVDPGSGDVRTDTAAGTPSTQIAFSDLTALGIDATNVLTLLTVDDLITFQQLDNAANWGRYRVSGPPINNGTWFLVPVAGVEQHGTIAKSVTVLVTFSYGGGGGGAGSGVQEVYAETAAPGAGSIPVIWVDTDDTSLAGSVVAVAWLRWTGTRAEYAAVSPKDPNTLYVTTD